MPKITDELYLEFNKTGTRVNFEKKLDLLEQRMAAFALAECGENQGKAYGVCMKGSEEGG